MATKKAHPAEPLAPEIADTEDHKTMPDGRTMRAERNRQVVVEAFSLLLKEGSRNLQHRWSQTKRVFPPARSFVCMKI